MTPYHVMKSCYTLECPLLPINMYSVGIYMNPLIKMIADINTHSMNDPTCGRHEYQRSS